MADKKSFVMYESWGAAIEKMNNEQAGELIKAIYAFQKNPDVVPEDPAIAFVFEIIKQKLEEDNKRYEEVCAARSEGGKKGGRPKANGSDENLKVNEEEDKNLKVSEKNQKGFLKKLKEPDTDTEYDTESDTDTESENKITSERKKQSKKRAAASAYVSDPALNAAISDFVEHRKKLRKPMTDRAIQLLIIKLQGMADSVPERIELINTAIEHGWQTVYAPKDPAAEPRGMPASSVDDYLLGIINGGET